MIDNDLNHDSLPFLEGEFHQRQAHEIKNFLENNQKELGIRVLNKQISHKLQTTAQGEDDLIVELTELSDGSKCEMIISSTPKKDDPDSHKSTYTVDMSNVKTEAQARQVLGKAASIGLACEIKFKSAGQSIQFKSSGFGKWQGIFNEVMFDEVQKRIPQLNEKGISKVSFNGIIMYDARVDNDLQDDRRQSKRPTDPKPWDVPRGAPDLKNKH